MASVVTIAVHVASHVGAGLHGIAGAFQSVLGALPGMIGQTFSQTGQALSGGIGNALKEAGSNPYVAAGIAALVASIAPVLGTLIGGALVLALGGALVGVGAMFAAKAKSVKTAWTRTFSDIKKGMADSAKPLEPVLKHAAVLVDGLFKKMKPFLDIFYKTVSPSIDLLFQSLAKSFASFGPILPTLGKAFAQLITALSPELAQNVSSIAKALNGLFKEFAKKDTANAFADVIGLLLGTIPLAIRILRGLTVVFTYQWAAIKQEIGIVKQLIRWIGKIVGKTVHIGQKGASAVIDWVKRAISWIKRFVGKVVHLGQTGASNVINWVKSVINWIKRFVGKTVHLGQTGASAVVNWVKSIYNWVKRLFSKTIHVGVSGATAAVNAIKRVYNWVKNLFSKTISIGVNVVGAGKSLLGKLFAKGGIIGAAVGGPRGADVMVGEQGPEMVHLPFGSTVKTNSDTRRVMASQAASGGSSSGPIQVILNLGDRKFAEVLIDPLRKTIQTKGGVQAALGKL